jgi:L-2-hydroxyglutarate oxidase
MRSEQASDLIIEMLRHVTRDENAQHDQPGSARGGKREGSTMPSIVTATVVFGRSSCLATGLAHGNPSARILRSQIVHSGRCPISRYVVVGGGIVGLATAQALLEGEPGAVVTVLEKETRWATHQTGHNSGVVHSGVAYAPGSLKAQLCTAGSRSMLAYAREHDVPAEPCGKLVLATEPAELPRLEALYLRGQANGVPVRRLRPEQARELEPEVNCLAAVHVTTTAVIDYVAVCDSLAHGLVSSGADLRLSAEVFGLTPGVRSTVVHSSAGDAEAEVVVNCAGLASDRVASLMGSRPPVRIVPFRGEYYVLKPTRAHLVRGLVYPVADPMLPFLGVHLTRGIDGTVHVGPNAVLALAREGYRRNDVSARDLVDTLTYPGFWRLAAAHARTGVDEVRRSFSKQRFAASAARLIPAVSADDLEPATSGVRAQAVRRDGSLVDDFLVLRRGRTLHVLNAPSPAATSSLEIAGYVSRLARRLRP